MSESAERFKRRKIGTCPSGCITLAYDVPLRLDESIIPFLEPLGKLAFSFEKTSILKLECQNFTISGIKRLKEIRVVLKAGTVETDLIPFEKALDNWLIQSKEK